jgi:hypothetical protein
MPKTNWDGATWNATGELVLDIHADQKTKYIWEADGGENMCDLCAALHGTEYVSLEDVPELPHPNCNCMIRDVSGTHPRYIKPHPWTGKNAPKTPHGDSIYIKSDGTRSVHPGWNSPFNRDHFSPNGMARLAAYKGEIDRDKKERENNKKGAEMIQKLMQEIGLKSRMKESDDDSTRIGQDSTGGYSYGAYQISTRSAGNPSGYGTMPKFMDSLKNTNPEAYKKLMDAGGLVGAKSGTEKFKGAWKEVAKNDSFRAAENDFFYREYYVPAMKILKEFDSNSEKRGVEVQQAVLGQQVQFGNKSNSAFFKGLTGEQNIGNLSDREFINALYERKVRTVDLYFKSSTQVVRDSVRKRFEDEWKEFLGSMGD